MIRARPGWTFLARSRRPLARVAQLAAGGMVAGVRSGDGRGPARPVSVAFLRGRFPETFLTREVIGCMKQLICYAPIVLNRDYEGQDCSIARALEVVGERWTL